MVSRRSFVPLRPWRSAVLSALALVVPLLGLTACGDDDPAGPQPGTLPERDTVLTHTWAEGELGALAYDPVHDALFLLEDVHSGDNVIHRWRFTRPGLEEVHRYASQHDYGMRVIGDELWIARTYDEAIRRITDLGAPTLGGAVDHDYGFGSLATEIGDLAPLDGDVLFVTHNALTSEQEDGVQRVRGPDFATPEVMVDESTLGWPTLESAAFRSLLVLGQGPDARIVVTTGRMDSDLVVVDRQGQELFRAAGFGRSHLQQDSRGRVYATGDDLVVRWSADFSTREDFDYEIPRFTRFVLRETATHVEFVYGVFRSEDTEIERIRLPR